MIAALEAAGIKPIVLTPEETAHGAVETYEDAKKCAALFKKHAAEDRRHHYYPAELRRGARACRYVEAGKPAGSGTDSGRLPTMPAR